MAVALFYERLRPAQPFEQLFRYLTLYRLPWLTNGILAAPNHCRRNASAERSASTMMVSAGLAGRALGKTELSAIQRLLIS
jgi:hypothetical protein